MSAVLALVLWLAAMFGQAAPDASPREGGKPIIDNERVRVWDLTLAAGKPTRRHQYDVVNEDIFGLTRFNPRGPRPHRRVRQGQSPRHHRGVEIARLACSPSKSLTSAEMLDAFIILSEGRQIPAAREAQLVERGPAFTTRPDSASSSSTGGGRSTRCGTLRCARCACNRSRRTAGLSCTAPWGRWQLRCQIAEIREVRRFFDDYRLARVAADS